MRLEKASKKAVQYACIKFHYAKVVPAQYIGYSVFNDLGEWCGVILFGGGAGAYMGKPYGLNYGQYLELTRMALNGKQESTSKAMSIAIRLIKKDCPTVKLLISYSDKGQNHYGTIYQATNWYFVEENESSGKDYFYKGKWRHDRTLNEYPKEFLSKLESRKRSGKRKYIFPLDKSFIHLCKGLSKPYPKQASKVHELNSSHSSEKEEGANPIYSL
jgi:hypothetical protein